MFLEIQRVRVKMNHPAKFRLCLLRTARLVKNCQEKKTLLSGDSQVHLLNVCSVQEALMMRLHRSRIGSDLLYALTTLKSNYDFLKKHCELKTCA